MAALSLADYRVSTDDGFGFAKLSRFIRWHEFGTASPLVAALVSGASARVSCFV